MEESNYWTRLNRKRISRRALLSAGATIALGAAAAAVVGCGGGGHGNGHGGSSSDNGPGETSAPEVYGPPVPGGTVIQGRRLNVLGIDPHDDLSGLDIDRRLYSYLY